MWTYRKAFDTRSVLSILAMSLCCSSPSTTAMPLPDPLANAVLYGDFYSYSLPILAFQYDLANGGTIGVGPKNPFYVASGPGQILNDIVIASGAKGKPVYDNFDGMNDAYATPNSSGKPYFSTDTASDPGNSNIAPISDLSGTWDSSITAFMDFLQGDTPVFLFNNNQENSGGAESQTLSAWMQVVLWDSNVGIGGASSEIFTLANHCPQSGIGVNICLNGGEVSLDMGGIIAGPDKDPTAYERLSGLGNAAAPLIDEFVVSGGRVCVAIADNMPVDCATGLDALGNSHGDAWEQFDHNLGADQAAYAVISEELNAYFTGAASLGSLDMISIDLRLGCDDALVPGGTCADSGRILNNGYEQLFVRRSEAIYVPSSAPMTIGLLGLGLLAGGYVRRRVLVSACGV